MRDFMLLLCVIAYMIGGYFAVGKAAAFWGACYKGFSDENTKDEREECKTEKNNDNPLRKE